MLILHSGLLVLLCCRSVTHSILNTTPCNQLSSHINIAAKYLYIETSSPRRPGDVARLQSPVSYNRSYCFIFWYHMFGSSIQTLDIYAQGASDYKQLKWTMSGNQGNRWHKADVDFDITNITAGTSYKVSRLHYHQQTSSSTHSLGF